MLIGTTLISSIEFQGNISLVIFYALCPLRCPFCHNKDILESGIDVSFDEIKMTIDDSLDYLDAIVITGGEPLVQLNEVIKVLEYAKSLNLKTKLDTSGIYPEKLEKLLKLDLLDYIALDVKAPFNKYKEIIGSDIGNCVKDSMDLINNYDKVTLELRTTYVPNLLNEKDIQEIASSVKGDIYTLQQFRNINVLDESLNDVESPNPHELEKIAKSLRNIFRGKIKIKSSEFGEEII